MAMQWDIVVTINNWYLNEYANGEERASHRGRSALLARRAKQKARVISIVQLRNITAAMLGLQPFRVVWGPAFM